MSIESFPDLIVLAAVLLAAFVHGAFGFGFPMVATPLLALTMDLRSAILLSLVPTICINLVSIAGERHWRGALRRFWPIPVCTIIGSLIGTRVLLSVDPEPFRLLLAFVLVAYLLAERLQGVDRERQVPKWGLALLGLGLGLAAGVVNIFAPIIVVFALYTRMRPELMVAAFNLSFITSKTGQFIGFAAGGALDMAVLEQALWALPLILLVLWAGIRLRRRIHPERFRQLVRVGLWIMAIALIWQAAGGLFPVAAVVAVVAPQERACSRSTLPGPSERDRVPRSRAISLLHTNTGTHGEDPYRRV